MAKRVDRQTVDLAAYPDLVVIYLGMRVNALSGIKRLLGLGPQIQKSAAAKPDGLLLHENVFFSPRHIGMRQYWRNYATLEAWTRSEPHQQWWKQFLKDSGGTGFWHETYCMRGGMEAIFDDIKRPTGLLKFAPAVPARGAMFSARRRLGAEGEAPAAPVTEESLYAGAAKR